MADSAGDDQCPLSLSLPLSGLHQIASPRPAHRSSLGDKQNNQSMLI